MQRWSASKPWQDGGVEKGEGRRGQKARSGFPERASLNLAPLTGLEPVTYGLTVRRSTD